VATAGEHAAFKIERRGGWGWSAAKSPVYGAAWNAQSLFSMIVLSDPAANV